ncbi:MAG TPA: cell division protein FtsL [Candidatus Angelobacter sp.]|nr:cell division protein FtsL [Candidatus Angelobacter sp.]
MAARAMNITGMITPVRRASAGITPEFYFAKAIDNSRVVRAVDPKRAREMRVFSGSVLALFFLVMFYALQHFSALQYGYRIEAQKSERDRLIERRNALNAEEAALRDPGRIDVMARQMGLEAPRPGQVVRLDDTDNSGPPVIAQLGTITVIPAQ